MHHERNRLVDLELRPAVQRRKLLSIQHKLYEQHAALRIAVRARDVVADTEDTLDFRILENRHVKLRCLFRLRVEPQTGTDLLHASCLPLFHVRVQLVERACPTLRHTPASRIVGKYSLNRPSVCLPPSIAPYSFTTKSRS